MLLKIKFIKSFMGDPMVRSMTSIGNFLFAACCLISTTMHAQVVNRCDSPPKQTNFGVCPKDHMSDATTANYKCKAHTHFKGCNFANEIGGTLSPSDGFANIEVHVICNLGESSSSEPEKGDVIFAKTIVCLSPPGDFPAPGSKPPEIVVPVPSCQGNDVLCCKGSTTGDDHQKECENPANINKPECSHIFTACKNGLDPHLDMKTEITLCSQAKVCAKPACKRGSKWMGDPINGHWECAALPPQSGCSNRNGANGTGVAGAAGCPNGVNPGGGQ